MTLAGQKPERNQKNRCKLQHKCNIIYSRLTATLYLRLNNPFIFFRIFSVVK